MSDVGDWFRNLPFFTRWWFALSLAFPLLARFGILNPRLLILDLYAIKRFQFWRLATSLFYYPLHQGTGFHFLLNLYFLYNYSIRLETGVFDGRPADYFFMLIFNWICLVIVGLMAELLLLMDPMVLCVLYIWCQLNKDVIVQFWFGTQFKAMYLPWVLFAFNLILSGGGMYEIIGILVGHLYFFLKFKYPQDFGGRQFLKTPDILYKYFPSRTGGFGGFGQAPQRPRPQDDPNRPRQRHDWGRGYVLGDN